MGATALRINEAVVETVSLQSRALVVGLGQTGYSCIAHLLARGYQVTAVDTRSAPPLAERLAHRHPEVPLQTGQFRADSFVTADLIVVSPGVSIRQPVIQAAMARGAEIVGDVELFLREVTAPVIAITGSNGKSTVTALVGEMCAAAGKHCAVVGNIGKPVLEQLAEQDREPDCYALELSSFQLETTASLRAAVAVVLNLSEDHMDRYDSLVEYAAAKARVYQGASLAVVNRDDRRLAAMVPAATPAITFGADVPHGGRDYGLRADGELWLVCGDRRLLRAAEVPLAGRHNLLNVLAAMALASAVGVGNTAMVDAVRRFRGLTHRMELITQRQGVRWINDSKATNVGATVAALAGLDEPVVLIAGGDGKGADFSGLRTAVADRARAVLLFGRDAALIESALSGAAPLERVPTLDAAVLRAAQLARAGDVVLLAPACASFDMFTDYAARGEAFRAAVRNLA